MNVIVGTTPVTLGAPLSSGGGGDYFQHPLRPAMGIKIAHDPLEVDETRYRSLIARTISPLQEQGVPTYAWPTNLVFDPQTGRVIGFEMPGVFNAAPLKAVFDPRFRVRGMSASWIRKVAISFLTRIHVLHLEGFVLIDFNPNNFLVHRCGLVSQIDIDSLCFRSHNGVAYGADRWRAEFLPPELQGIQSPFNGFEQHHDAWAACTVLHIMFRNGFNPFDVEWLGSGRRPTLLENIRHGVWADSRPHAQFRPRQECTPFCTLDPRFQELSWRMFVEGHADPSKRPTVTDLLNCVIAMPRPASFLERRISKRTWSSHFSDSHTTTKPSRPVSRRKTDQPGRASVVRSAACTALLAATYAAHSNYLASSFAKRSIATPFVHEVQRYAVRLSHSWTLAPSEPATSVRPAPTPDLWPAATAKD